MSGHISKIGLAIKRHYLAYLSHQKTLPLLSPALLLQQQQLCPSHSGEHEPPSQRGNASLETLTPEEPGLSRSQKLGLPRIPKQI